ncbi:DUF2155 domain-containing protein [Asaia prunellae]|uniref:DUF2155 domain-containing protein n=1 Tax=Asaia prunellae TaxID=610245 RepID=UPI0006845525|nr:DUF2155 domain-containing protein [Asaia prunellae]
MKKASSRNRLFVVLPLLMAPCLTLRDAIISPVWAAEAVAPPVMYPADLWQGRGEAVIRILNRTDSHIETLTVPVGGQAQYRSLHVGVTRCVERPETLPRDAAALITTTDETDPDTHYEGWILAEEPSLTGYKSALYGISIVSCSGPKADPSLAPLPHPFCRPSPGQLLKVPRTSLAIWMIPTTHPPDRASCLPRALPAFLRVFPAPPVLCQAGHPQHQPVALQP